jgi:CelD/BcsL family acetyltransferase involved in cellulose biosynthesis
VQIALHVGDDALRQLASPLFHAAWDALHVACPWATVFQGRSFASIWYRVYSERYEPVIVVGRMNGSDAADGLLLLARERATRALVHVGALHAEYQLWLARPATSDDFIEPALDALSRELDSPCLNFFYVPPGVPLGFTERGRVLASRLQVGTERRGLVQLGDGSAIRARLQKSAYRKRLRRLALVGEVKLLRIENSASMAPWFDAVVDACDFRQCAKNNSRPFRNDPLKRALHDALFDEPGILHTTLLVAGEHFVSAQINWRAREGMVLGLVAHAPQFGKLSPGSLHVLLAEELAQREGMAMLDLSPSGEYKHRLATQFDEVHTLTMHLSGWSKLKAGARRMTAHAAKKTLVRVGLSLDQARQVVANVRSTMQRKGLADRMARAARSRSKPTELHVCMRVIKGLADVSAPPMKCNALADLLACNATMAGASSLSAFLATALSRIEDGMHCYTCVGEGGRLVRLAWMRDAGERIELPAAGTFVKPQLRSVVLEDLSLYSDQLRPDEEAVRTKAYAEMISWMIQDAASQGVAAAYVTVRNDDTALRHAVDSLGFAFIDGRSAPTALPQIVELILPPIVGPVSAETIPSQDAEGNDPS